MSWTSRTTQGGQSAEDVLPKSAHWTQTMRLRLLDQAAQSELDRCYWAFVETLPPRLAQLATDQRTVAGRGPSDRFHTVAGIGVIVAIPWMFRDTFPHLKEEQLLNVGQAWTFLAAAAYLRDHMADGQVPAGPDAENLLEKLTTKARDVLRSLVNNQSAFWQRFEQYEQRVVSALQLEAAYRRQIVSALWSEAANRTLSNASYDLEMFRQIAIGKFTPIKVPICAMAALCEEMSSFPKLEGSVDAWAAGRQLYDDTVDWQEDLARGHYTYPLIQAINHLKKSRTPISQETIEEEMYKSTIREDALRQSKAWLQEALGAVEGTPCQGWVDFITACQGENIAEHCRLILCQIAKAL